MIEAHESRGRLQTPRMHRMVVLLCLSFFRVLIISAGERTMGKVSSNPLQLTLSAIFLFRILIPVP